VRIRLAIGILAATVALAACSSNGGNGESGSNPASSPAGANSGQASPSASSEEQADPYGPVAKPVTITIGKNASQNTDLPAGSTIEDNELTRYISQKLNVTFKDAWQASGDGYTQKVSLTLASGDLPDVMVVNKQQLVQMTNAGLIEDLTDSFNKYVSPNLKAAYDSTNGYSLQSATIDGKLMGLPNINPGADAENLLWVRKDWLDELGLQEPKTLDDIIAISKAFQEKKGAVGLLGSQTIVNVGNNPEGFDTIFSLFNSYPKMWIQDDSGKVVYGSITPETKTALAKLREMYQDGVIDKEFAVKTGDQNNELIVSGKAGIYFGPWWEPFSPLNDSITQDSKAEWVAYLAPLGEDGKLNTHNMAPSDAYLVVRKGFESPEAVIKTANYQFDIDQLQGEGIVKNDPYSWTNMPFTLLLSRYDDKESKALAVQKVIDGQASADSLQGEAAQVYQSYLKDKQNPKKDVAAWSQAHAFLTGALPLAGDGLNKKMGVFYDVTDTMKMKWANLQKLETETFLKIILGTEPLDSFDTFVEKWKSQGGDQITKEVEKEIAK